MCSHAYCAACAAIRLDSAKNSSVDLAFHCCSCGHSLHRHDLFTECALSASCGQKQDQEGSSFQTYKTSGRCGDKWQSSAKVDAVMKLLHDLRAKAAATGELQT